MVVEVLERVRILLLMLPATSAIPAAQGFGPVLESNQWTDANVLSKARLAPSGWRHQNCV